MTRPTPPTPPLGQATPSLAVAALLALLAAACGGGGGSTAGSDAGRPIPEAAKAEAEQIFAMRCTPCHGPEGRGDGPAAAALDPKPRNHTSTEWQASVSDEQIETIILEGGPAVGLSALMPPNPDLASKPDVVRALRAHVRSLGGT